jgi:hypothetical protein
MLHYRHIQSPALQLVTLCVLIFLIAGVGVFSPFITIAWTGDDEDDGQWSKNEWEKDSLNDHKYMELG